MTEARNYRGFDPDGVAETEADHFMKCPGCGEWFDMRDLDQLLAHVHDAEIEIMRGTDTAEAQGSVALDLNAKPASKPSRDL
jgi:hypothetical protein